MADLWSDLMKIVWGSITSPETIVPGVELLKYLTPIGFADIATGGAVTGAGGAAPTGVDTPMDKTMSNRWLLALGGTTIALAAAPFIYQAFVGPTRGKRGKKASEYADRLENASSRATTLAAALLPAAALPITYITVQALEDRIIPKGVGDSVQGLITAGMVAPAIGAITGLAAKAIK